MSLWEKKYGRFGIFLLDSDSKLEERAKREIRFMASVVRVKKD
ncbi:MAG TPA: hypothetical protein VEK32_10405 [Thermodesulfobacteriota bacterium]|nr:hypothetical protein [Thermodesulfobacteriota bacterium]